MRHKKTPDENGWYWIEDECGEWWMAHLDAESDPQRLTLVDPADGAVHLLESHADGNWNDRQMNVTSDAPTQWIGPIGCPGGRLGDNGVYFSAEFYDKTEAEGRSLVMVYVDHGDTLNCASATIGLVSHDESWDLMSRVFPHNREPDQPVNAGGE